MCIYTWFIQHLCGPEPAGNRQLCEDIKPTIVQGTQLDRGCLRFVSIVLYDLLINLLCLRSLKMNYGFQMVATHKGWGLLSISGSKNSRIPERYNEGESFLGPLSQAHFSLAD